jgi:hypothetical protein
MQITELIEELERVKMSHGEDVEVRLGTQPNYPFEHEIAGVSEPLSPDLFEENEGPAEDRNSDKNINKTVVYIAEGTQIGYMPCVAKEELEYVW